METKNKTQSWYHFLILFILICISFYQPFLRMTGTTFMQNVMISLTSVISIRILNFLNFRLFDYGLLFCGIFSTLTIPYWEINISSFLIFLFFFGISFFRKELQKGKVLFTWLTFISFLLNDLFLSFIYRIFMPIYFHITKGITGASMIKIIIFCILSALVLGLDSLLFWFVKRLFGKFFLNVSQLETSYPQIAGYFIAASTVLFLFEFFLQYQLLNFIRIFQYDHTVYLAIEKYQDTIYTHITSITYTLSISVIVIQFFILLILLKFSTYRFTIDAKRRYEEDLLLYSNGLEENLTEIRNLKHDMKNVLFTLSHLIENSKDIRLKEYFQQTINPYFQKELKKNDLYTSLQQIEDEQLKAFLYYKLTSAFYDNLNIHFSLEQKFNENLFINEIDFLDFIRILGIFLDNAMEEAGNTTSKELDLYFSEYHGAYEIQISNSIRADKKVIPGLSDKGLGRGNGLLIVQNILKKYPNITLNSYTDHEKFVQSLMINELP